MCIDSAPRLAAPSVLPKKPSRVLALSNLVYGVFFCAVCALIFVWLGVAAARLLMFPPRHWWHVPLGMFCAFWALVVQLRILFQALHYIARSLRTAAPIPLEIARAQRQSWTWLRPLVGLWWLLHFFLSICITVATELVPLPRGPVRKIAFAVIATFLVAVFCELCYGFALIAFGCFFTNERRLESMWDWRWAWGATMAAIFLAIHLLR